MTRDRNCDQIEIADDRNKYTVMMAVPKYSTEEKSLQNRSAIFSSFQINTLNIFVVLSVALLLSASIVNAAPQSSKAPTEHPTEVTTSGAKICHSTTPCGWAVYIPFTRRVDYFMRNTCACPSDKACLKKDDDLSISAYVYRCDLKPNDDNGAPNNYDDK